MVRFLLRWIFIGALCGFLVWGTNREAVANPAIAAPVVAYGSLEVLAVGAAAAAGVGILSTQQNESFHAWVQDRQESIVDASREAADWIGEQAVGLFNKAHQSLRGESCSLDSQGRRSGSCNKSIEACCGKFIDKFGARMDKGSGGIRIWRDAKKKKMDCCLEWDHLHGGLEIFDWRGQHMGERNCEDLGDDPCEWTRTVGKHAEPKSTMHGPRSKVCKP